MTNNIWTSSPYFSNIFLSLATHSGVLCGVAVETANFNCDSFEDCAGADALKMRTIQTANNPANRDFILITIPPSLDLAMI
jgi:hypothetical protein